MLKNEKKIMNKMELISFLTENLGAKKFAEES